MSEASPSPAPAPAPGPSPAPGPTPAPTPTPTPAPAPAPSPSPAPGPGPSPAPKPLGSGDPPPPSPGPAPGPGGAFPENWREQLAGDDKAFLNQLKRYASPQAVAQWLRTTSLRISSGELKEVKGKPGPDATPEQLAAWRKENNLPADTAAYVAGLKLADGMVPGEADKPMLDAVAAMALERGYSQDAVNDFVGLYYDLQTELGGQRQEADQDRRLEANQVLVQQWGADYKANNNALKAFWAAAPEGVADTILGARLPDGRIVGDVPEIATYFANLARELDPAATLLPPGAAGGSKGIASRKAEIEGLMYKDSASPGRWGPHYTSALQAEYRELLDAEAKLAARGKAA